MSGNGPPGEPLFSVVIPTYNRPDLLRVAVESVLGQSVADLECIVVDDAGSEPATVPADPRVVLVRRPENGGLSAARNTGIARARGRYVTFLDDDDVLTPDRLAIAVEGLARAPVALCWRGNVGDPSGGVNRHLDGRVHDRILEDAVPHVGQAAVERALLPTFDEGFLAGEEVEWWLRLSEAPVATVARVGYLFRQHAGPRHKNDLPARVRFRGELLARYPRYFAEHPRAAGFQWKRIGLMAAQLGDHASARRAFGRSFRLRPQARTAAHWLRSCRPSSPAGPALGDVLRSPAR